MVPELCLEGVQIKNDLSSRQSWLFLVNITTTYRPSNKTSQKMYGVHKTANFDVIA